MQFWPEKPSRYRGHWKLFCGGEEAKFGLLELICEGLGLESGFFGDELTQVQVMALNHYPPCPDPSITLGLLT
ncbi:putative hyoscyamine (6S)-dioxygenase [Rosa chinensis]|uniref:Putative hyoscyamine (6S)-dioxygenase n=1 Tax=Rosa chinensis TaxID=74649 RepID=A0A2P6PVD5_ROSCH|nr:putative hyoscyamine (6S)-dioxygenase [Rosa chinensis]